MAGTLYEQVSAEETLAVAWRHVRRSGLLSQSERTRESIKAFDYNIDAKLAKTASELRQHSFDFGTAAGTPMKRPGKEPRPLLVAEIPARIVQRALLDTLQKQREIQDYVQHRCSYGGLPGKNREDAIRHVCMAITEGARYFVRSDIHGFFRRILRGKVLQVIKEMRNDDSISELLDRATNIEIGNAKDIEAYLHLFPDYNEGVAQGCCLSPLFGNIYMREFDKEMNSGDVVTLRYIDDFIILGQARQPVQKAFRRARQILRNLNLNAYQPTDGSPKATEGSVKKGVEFLGCKITAQRVEPSRAARSALLEKVKHELNVSAHQMRSDVHEFSEQHRASLVETLSRVSRMLHGWSEQYRFCNASDAFISVDKKVDRILDRYLRTFFKQLKKSKETPAVRRRLLGIWLVTDSTRTPIVPKRSR